MGKRGKEQFNPVREELLRLFSELQPVSELTVTRLQEGLTRGKARRVKTLVDSFNNGLGKGLSGLELKLLTERPTSAVVRNYRNQLIIKSPRNNKNPFQILWESGKYTGSFKTVDSATNSVDLLLSDEGIEPDLEIRTYEKKVKTINYEGEGFIYVAYNESLPEMVKIGMTTTSVTQRMKELSNTSVPTPFRAIAIFEMESSVLSIEQELHSRLTIDRIHSQREFFRCLDPVSYCVKIQSYLKDIAEGKFVTRTLPEIVIDKA